MSVPNAPQTKSGGFLRSIGSRLLVGVIGLAIAGGVAWYLNRDDAMNAEVGDCLVEEGSNELNVVDCGDSSAQWEVVGIEAEAQTQSEYLAAPDTCVEFSDAEQSFWYGEVGESGRVLCVVAAG